jgi:glutamate synthase (NADPH/NADH) small chain
VLIYGIPGFKLESIMRRWKLLEESGITFHLGSRSTATCPSPGSRSPHCGMIAAASTNRATSAAPARASPASSPHSTTSAANRHGLGDEVPEFASNLDVDGRHVVVVGGGDTRWIACAAVRREVTPSVKCLYRRDRADMPGSCAR